MGQLLADSRLPLYQRLRDRLAERVAAQSWSPAEAIPSETDLAATYRVSVGTVRKAVDSLVADGLLERRQGRGTFVRRPRFNSSLFRFFRFQSPTGEPLTPKSRILARGLKPAPAEAAAALRIEPGEPAVALSRLRVVDGAPLVSEAIWLPKQRFAALLDIAPADFGDLLYPLYESCCGVIVTSAEETLGVALADRAQASRLARKPGEPLIVIERVAFDAHRHPLEWRRSHGPADRFRYHVEIR
jgi:GntR family transcriptional regulator